MMSVVLLQRDTLVRRTVDGQYPPAHLDFNRDFESDTSKVACSIFKLFGELAVSLTQRKGKQQLHLVAEIIIVHEIHDELERSSGFYPGK